MHKYYKLLQKKQGQILSIGFYKVIIYFIYQKVYTHNISIFRPVYIRPDFKLNIIKSTFVWGQTAQHTNWPHW